MSLSPDVFKGLPQLTYLHLEKNQFKQFPKRAFALLPGLLALHLENNAITKLETGILTGAEKLRSLFLTKNEITNIAPGAFDPASDLATLHLGNNKLKEVPTNAFPKTGSLTELNLSHNPIRWIGAEAFLPIATSLKHLYLNNLSLEKVRLKYTVTELKCKSYVCMHSSFVIGAKLTIILHVITVLPNTIDKQYCDQKHLQTLVTS